MNNKKLNLLFMIIALNFIANTANAGPEGETTEAGFSNKGTAALMFASAVVGGLIQRSYAYHNSQERADAMLKEITEQQITALTPEKMDPRSLENPTMIARYIANLEVQEEHCRIRFQAARTLAEKCNDALTGKIQQQNTFMHNSNSVCGDLMNEEDELLKTRDEALLIAKVIGDKAREITAAQEVLRKHLTKASVEVTLEIPTK